MAEEEQKSRHALMGANQKTEWLKVSAVASATKRGQWLGFVISVCAIGGCVWTALDGVHWLISVMLVGVPVASIVIAFLKK